MSFEDRQDLPGHKSNAVKADYTAAANKMTQQESRNNFGGCGLV